jgi:hypothetical protein
MKAAAGPLDGGVHFTKFRIDGREIGFENRSHTPISAQQSEAMGL